MSETPTMLGQLKTHPFLDGLPDAWLEPMSHHAARTVRRAGHRLFHEGAAARHFWLIRDGRVALDFHLPGKGDVVIETLGAGTVLGWSWLFPPKTWHFGAVTVADTFAIEFDAAGILRLLDREPAMGFELSRRFMGVLLDRLQATRVRLLDLYAPPGDSAPSDLGPQA